MQTPLSLSHSTCSTARSYVCVLQHHTSLLTFQIPNEYSKSRGALDYLPWFHANWASCSTLFINSNNVWRLAKGSHQDTAMQLAQPPWELPHEILWVSFISVENAIPIPRYAGAYSFITWPEVSYLAEDSSGRVVGYVLSSMWVKVAHMCLRLIQEFLQRARWRIPLVASWSCQLSIRTPNVSQARSSEAINAAFALVHLRHLIWSKTLI